MKVIFNKYLTTLLISLSLSSALVAQRTMGGPGQMDQSQGEEEGAKTESIPPDVRAWRLTDHFTFSDTVAVDTLSTGYQIFNPIFKESIAQNYLGNLGSAYQSMIFDEQQRYYGNIFYNSLLAYIPHPHELNYYNTKTPYVNVTYHFGSPKRQSEEYITALYTQNVNKATNVGLSYHLSSSIGQYQGQKAENQNFKFWSSYNGKRYNMHTAFVYTKIENQENGGIKNNNPDIDFHKLDPSEVPMNFAGNSSASDANNNIDHLQFFYNHSLSIGNINVKGKDSTVTQLPVSTVYHTLKYEQGERLYSINNLPTYTEADNPFYSESPIDTIQTRDSTSFQQITNTFQIKFNEEANSLLKFGLRAYITNEVMLYKYPGKIKELKDDDGNKSYQYHTRDTSLINTAIGGQIFKNLGENFWWNAGAKLYFQGYRTGDSEITGSLNSQFRVGRDTAGLFANGGIYFQQPELFENQYNSNHFQWDEDFNQTKSIRIRGGMRIPTRRFELSGGINLINEHIFWQNNGLPDQTSAVLQVMNIRLKKHFILGRIHSVNDAILQYTSDEKYIPVPLLALYNSTFYENTLFQVLHFQIGFDLRYNTEYYAPKYMPATGIFVNQQDKKVGNYPFVDAFVNLQLKRARIYIKYDHVNQGYPDEPYYSSYQYPGNPRNLKFGVSWNFYD